MTTANTPAHPGICKILWEMAKHYKLLLKIVTTSEISSAVLAVAFALYFVIAKTSNVTKANLWLAVVGSLCSGAAFRVLVKKRESYKESLAETLRDILKHCNQEQSSKDEKNKQEQSSKDEKNK